MHILELFETIKHLTVSSIPVWVEEKMSWSNGTKNTLSLKPRSTRGLHVGNTHMVDFIQIYLLIDDFGFENLEYPFYN